MELSSDGGAGATVMHPDSGQPLFHSKWAPLRDLSGRCEKKNLELLL